MGSSLRQRLRRSPPDVVYTPIDVTSMDKREIINRVGPQVYWESAEKARRIAPHTGHLDVGEIEDTDIYDVVDDIVDLVWESDLGEVYKVRLAFEVYRDIPSRTLFWLFVWVKSRFSHRISFEAA